MSLISLLLIFVSQVNSQSHIEYLENLRSRENWKKILKWSNSCEDKYCGTFQKDCYLKTSKNKGLDFRVIGKGKYLVGIECWHGAYNGEYEYSYFDEMKNYAKPLKFYGLGPENKQGKRKLVWKNNINGGVAFKESNTLLSVHHKYAGHGFCGYWERYKFNINSLKFETMKIIANEECDPSEEQIKALGGIRAAYNKLWKVVYSNKNAPKNISK